MIVRELVNLIKFKTDEAGLRRAQQRANAFAGKMRNVGLGMSIALTAPLVLLGRRVTQAFTSFEDALLFLQARAKLTDDELERLSKRALQLAKNSVFTAGQTADAMNNLAAAGFNVNQVYSATPGVLDLAAASNMDLAETARVVAQGINSFSLSSEEAARVADSLTTASNSAATNLPELAQALSFAGGTAAGFGNNLEDTLAILASFAKRGILATRAGTSLRAALAQIAKPTPEVTRTLKKLGIQTMDSAGNLKPLIDIIGQLGRAGASTTDLLTIFGRRSAAAIQAAVALGEPALRAMADRMRTDVGSAARQATARLSGLGGAFRKLSSKLDVLFIKIAKSGFAKVIEKIVIGLGKFVIKLSELSPQMINMIVVFFAFLAVIGPTLLFLAGFIKVLTFVAGALAVAKVAFFGAAEGAAAFNVSMLLIPIAILAAIAAIALLVEDFLVFKAGGDSLIGLFLKSFPTLVAFFSDAFKEIRDTFMAFIGFIKNVFTGDFEAAINDIKNAWLNIFSGEDPKARVTIAGRIEKGRFVTAIDRVAPVISKLSEDLIMAADTLSQAQLATRIFGGGTISMAGAATQNVNINSTINLDIPPGMTAEHQVELEGVFRQTVIEENTKMIRNLQSNNPEVD